MITSSLSTESASYHEYVFEDPTQRMVLAILWCIVCVVGVTGNTCVLLAVSFSRKLQTKTNAFVVNLAIADFLSCAVLPLNAVAMLSNDGWPLPDYICSFTAFVMWLSLGGSIINLVLIAFNRFYIITRPRESYDRLYSWTNMAIMLTLPWLIPIFLLVVPPLCGMGRIGYSERYKNCSADSTHPLSDLYTALSSSVTIVPCLVILIVCYVRIYIFMRKRNRELLRVQSSSGVMSSSASSMQAAAFRRQAKVTKNLFLVVCSYVICIMPFGIACLIKTSYPSIPWVSAFLIMNSCVNPFIYGLNHPQFKVVFHHMFRCSCSKIPEPSQLLKSISTSTTN